MTDARVDYGAAAQFGRAKNQKELAAALGVSAVWVSRLKSAGRITPEADGAWCVASVRSQIAQTADLGQSIATETRAKARAGDADPIFDAPIRQILATAPTPDEDNFDQHYGPDHSLNFKIARSFREREEAAKARINRMQAAGLLVEKSEVDRAAYTEARQLRDRLMGLPTKIAPLLAPVSDAFELERMLREALRQVLADCVNTTTASAA